MEGRRYGSAETAHVEDVIYIPQTKMDQKPMERLIKLGKQRDQSVNYLVIEAILQYLEREENAQ